MNKYKCVIIGSGPAGYTAAIYAARANMKPVLYTGIEVGGQLTTTTTVENFPGYPEGVDGNELMIDLRTQAENMGCIVIEKMITDVEFSNSDNLLLCVEDNEWIKADSVIIATGATAKRLGIMNEYVSNISACAVCDGIFYKDCDVAIVGGGDTACEEALFLANFCKSVTMLIRSDKMTASKIMQNRVIENDKIIIKYSTFITDIIGNGLMEKLILNNGELITEALFIAIGHKPNSSLFTGYVQMDEYGYIKTRTRTSETMNNDDGILYGVFACGDVQDKYYRQAITAAASGCMAALDAERYLSSKND